MRKRRILIALSAELLIATAASQQQRPKARFTATCEPDAKRHVPYSAEFNLTNVYPGADGNLVTYNYSETQAFDSHGRFLGTTVAPDPKRKGPPQTLALECDPTTNTQYRWDSLKKSLLVLKMPTPEQRTGCWESEQGDQLINFDAARRLGADAAARMTHMDEVARDPDHANPLIEDLGTMTLQGVEAQGTRTTWPPAASSADGAPQYLTEEHWASPLLGIWLQQEVDYPPGNHSIKWSRRVTNLNLNEPEPSAFDPPADYNVVTETMHQVPCQDLAKSIAGGPIKSGPVKNR